MLPGKFSCLALDAVGTVLRPQPAAAVAYHRVGQEFGARLSVEEAARRLRAAYLAEEGHDLGSGLLRTDEDREHARWRRIVHSVFAELPETARNACFERLFGHFARADAWQLYDDARQLLQAATALGMPVVLASNFDRRLLAVCRGLRLDEQLRGCVVSSLVGYRKPHQRFFDALVETCRCPADRVLYVGDSYVNDLLGARAAGLTAVLVDRSDRFQKECPGWTVSSLTTLLECLHD